MYVLNIYYFFKYSFVEVNLATRCSCFVVVVVDRASCYINRTRYKKRMGVSSQINASKQKAIQIL